MSRRRVLHPDEQEIWHAVARTAKPMHPRVFVPKSETVIPPPMPAPIPRFQIGQKSVPKPAVSLPSALQMDAKKHAKMTRGKLAPEARIDLHGMTMARAHPELIRFILGAQDDGLRLVLVITGKGKAREDSGPIPQPMGVLRHNVPLWLRQMPLAPVVLQVSEAHARHGGAGAIYVYLRRR